MAAMAVILGSQQVKLGVKHNQPAKFQENYCIKLQPAECHEDIQDGHHGGNFGQPTTTKIGCTILGIILSYPAKF